MNRTTRITKILLVCLACSAIAGCASTQNIENVLRDQRWNDLDSALQDYMRFNLNTLGENTKMVDSSNSVARFLKQDESCKKLGASANINDKEHCYQEAIRMWNHVPSPLPFSQRFVDDLNDRKNRLVSNIQEIQHEKYLHEQESRKQEEELKKQKESEWQWGQEADKLLRDADERSLETPEYIVQGSSCNICGYIVEKKRLEKVIEEEKSYSNKYGVVNLGKIDRDKQYIIQIDQILADKKKIYKKHAGKNFDTSQCRTTKLETCDDKLGKLQKEITSRLVAEQLSLIQEQDKKNYMTKYISDKQSSE